MAVPVRVNASVLSRPNVESYAHDGTRGGPTGVVPDRRVGVDRKDQPLTRVIADVVVRLRRVVVPDEQAVLVREMGDPVPIRIVEVVWAELEGLVVPAVVAVLRDVGVEVREGLCPAGDMEALVGLVRRELPARLGLRSVRRLSGDLELVDREPGRDRPIGALDASVGEVAEA